ncbi:uncharacterized protein LTR77_005813 [Saxophila tyrrhenica]|uniref:Uncharacterized protein n=1 Tax=Saxophila tyrrhenica TaxID=1690608 RepID=A0AAV9PDN4_9PEZI|nr:hypothetical protein LTR77_005813 [Saxophila tyrrhenica]
MAPYTRSKRQRSEKHQPLQPKDLFSTLPEGIVLQIPEELPDNVIPSLRLVCSNAVPCCNTIIAKRSKTLYFHPSANSMQNVIAACEHPILSKDVEELVLLGDPMWREIELAYPGCRQKGLEYHRHRLNIIYPRSSRHERAGHVL